MSTDDENENKLARDPDDTEDADDAGDEGDEVSESTSGSPAALLDASGNPVAGAEAQEEARVAPRNRAERRALAKKVERGQATAEGEEPERDRNRAAVRPKVPPRTVTGKSTANTEEIPPWARSAGEWLSARRTSVFAAAAAVVLGGVGISYALQARDASRGAAANGVVQTAELANAEVRGPDAPADPPGLPPRRIRPQADHTARARAVLAAAEQAVAAGVDLPTAPIAKLQRGIALYDLGRFAEARSTLEPVVGASLAGLEGRALEVLGFCLEALNDLPGALRRFEELGRLEGDGWRDLGAYHQARVLRRQRQDDRAKDILRRLIERVERARPDDTAAAASRSVLEQAKGLLHEIAPEDPLGRRESGPSDPDAIMRMIQQQLGGRAQIRRPGQGGAP